MKKYQLIEYEGDDPKTVVFDVEKISRVTIVGENGREFEKWFDSAEFSLQDDGRTLKIFIKGEGNPKFSQFKND
jgi:hypothetical protein